MSAVGKKKLILPFVVLLSIYLLLILSGVNLTYLYTLSLIIFIF